MTAINAAIDYESADAVARITITRAGKHNAINNDVALGLHEAWLRFAQGEDRVAILTGQGEKAFSAGADLKDLPRDTWRAMPNTAVPCDKPIIAAVNGLAIGAGATLVMMSDMAVAEEHASFIYPEAKIGVFAGLMGGFSPRMQYKAGLEWMMTGDPMTAQRAYEIGLVNRLAPKGQGMTVALEVATKIARNAPLVIQAMKSISRSVLPKSSSELYYEQGATLNRIAQSADKDEGVASFREKRSPKFVGR